MSKLAAASLAVIATAILSAQTVATPGVHPVSGRRFANVMGWQGADWLERSERELEEEPEKALDALGPLTAFTVADVGAGSGYFTVRLAPRVGSKGRVYANDLQPEMLKMLAARLNRERLSNVTLVHGLADDPKRRHLHSISLMVDVPRIFRPQKMLRGIRAALKRAAPRAARISQEDPDAPSGSNTR
jgi:SAM-dependent methyltransferase